MIKLLITFVSLFIILYVSIELFRKFTVREKWGVIKTALYSVTISLAVIVIMSFIVLLF